MRLRFQLGAAASAALAAGLMVSGCGSAGSGSGSSGPGASGSTEATVVPQLQAAVRAAKSVHMVGSATSAGHTITFDMSFYGKNGMSGSFGEGGGSFSLLAVGGKTYFKVDAGFLKLSKAPAAACSLVCGKYMEVPVSETGQITGSLSMAALSGQAFGKLPASVLKDKTGKFVPATFDGQPVLQFRGGGYTIDVAATGTPYPVLVRNSSGDNITFSEWNAVSAPAAPPASQVVNLSQL
jgi:hypothetical protein